MTFFIVCHPRLLGATEVVEKSSERRTKGRNLRATRTHAPVVHNFEVAQAGRRKWTCFRLVQHIIHPAYVQHFKFLHFERLFSDDSSTNSNFEVGYINFNRKTDKKSMLIYKFINLFITTNKTTQFKTKTEPRKKYF